MINLLETTFGSPLMHTVPSDPGTRWARDTQSAIEPPPDHEVDPLPETHWPTEATRTGIYGAVSPRIITLSEGGYLMY